MLKTWFVLVERLALLMDLIQRPGLHAFGRFLMLLGMWLAVTPVAKLPLCALDHLLVVDIIFSLLREVLPSLISVQHSRCLRADDARPLITETRFRVIQSKSTAQVALQV
ncbi:hypothetical protein EJB05_00093, partial [Eragrostis curvula]